jgi:hypothetical protein
MTRLVPPDGLCSRCAYPPAAGAPGSEKEEDA